MRDTLPESCVYCFKKYVTSKKSFLTKIFLDMMEDSQRDNCVNKEEEDKSSTSEKDCCISIEITCDNDRNVAEAKAASVDDEQMQWTNCEAGKDCASKTSTVESVQKMDVSPGKEQCRSVWFLRYIFGYPGDWGTRDFIFYGYFRIAESLEDVVEVSVNETVEIVEKLEVSEGSGNEIESMETHISSKLYEP